VKTDVSRPYGEASISASASSSRAIVEIGTMGPKVS
jgi:hypothetical protein